jgi:hypothetical protein
MHMRAEFEGHLLALLRHRPTVHLPSAERLEQLSQLQMDHESAPSWRTFWSLATHFFAGLRLQPGHSFEEAEGNVTSQVLSGLLLREQFEAASNATDDNLQVINHLLFLEQADVISHRLLNVLSEWSDSPEADLPIEAQLDVQIMAQLAQDVELTGVQEVADSMAVQLARLRTHRVVEDIQISVSGAQELSRLLQHFAVGSVREPYANVLTALRGE